MGKNLIQQARGKGGPRYRSPSFRYKAEVKYSAKAKEQGRIVDFVKCQGHSAPLAQIEFKDGSNGYLIAAEGLRVGDHVKMGGKIPIQQGNTLQLKDIPVGTQVFNIEKQPGDGGKFVRAGGVTAKIVAKNEDKIIILLPSKKQKTFHPGCRASIGTIAGGGRKDKPFLKAGTRHHKLKAKNKLYPLVSGQAMNAVDHPHGGSSSSTKSGPYSVSRHAPPGKKVGQIASKRTGRKKK